MSLAQCDTQVTLNGHLTVSAPFLDKAALAGQLERAKLQKKPQGKL
jgi:hypothetical protein